MLRSKKNLFLFFIFLNAFAFAQTKVIPYQELPTSSGASSGSGIFFSAAMNPTFVTITFEGPANRWIALGLGTAMYTTDVIVYSNGQLASTHALGWRDYFNTSHNGSGVTLDASQDWTIVSTNTVSSQRTVTATRSLTTGDANDIAISYTASALDLVWAAGATADYTIAYHGSSNRASGISLPWQSMPTASFSALSTTVCAGSAVSFSNQSQGGQTTYTWNFGSGNPATSTLTNPSITYTNPGTYSVSLITSNAVGTATYVQTNYISVTASVAPALSISQISGNNPICAGSPATFSATAINGGTSPVYQWKVNGTNVGTNTSTFSSTSLSNGAVVSCILTSNFTCATPSTATSSAITMTVNSTAAASVSITQNSGTNPMCVGVFAGFTATTTNEGSNPIFHWQINGITTVTTAGSIGFSTSSLINGDVVSCILYSSNSCASNTAATSSGITMTVSSVLVPSIAISMTSGSNPMCTGAPATFSANYANGGMNPIFQWHLNTMITGGNSPTLSLPGPFSGTVDCSMYSSSPCASATLITSPALNMTIHATPVTTVSPMGVVALCTGTHFLAIGSASTNVLWSNGVTTQTILINQPGTYGFTQTVNGCSGVSPVFTVVSVVQPTVSLFIPQLICKDSPTLALQGQPSGGFYLGSGVTGNVLDPSLIGNGPSFVLYMYAELFGGTPACVDTAMAYFSISDCAGVTENNNSQNLISVYPNPSHGEFVLQSAFQKIKTVHVYDISGKQIFAKTDLSANTAIIDLKEFKQGVYLVELQLESQVVRTRIYKTD
ncbi:hypothetical protein CNR22_08845 [Sphingobacteriaceae bacterium]|nr:hypothetical protein CNR22_08845 [Sphingobacteriaceae bacterium]